MNIQVRLPVRRVGITQEDLETNNVPGYLEQHPVLGYVLVLTDPDGALIEAANALVNPPAP